MKETLLKNANRLLVLAVSYGLVNAIDWLDYGYYDHYFSLLCAGLIVVMFCVRYFGVFYVRVKDAILVGYAIVQAVVMANYLMMLTELSVYSDKFLYTGPLSLANMMLIYELFMLVVIGGSFVMVFLGWLFNTRFSGNHYLQGIKRVRR